MLSSGINPSIWMKLTPMLSRQPLKENLRCEVCIVGAGMAGLTTAYMLTRSGRSVVVLDDGLIASGESGRTTAHLSNAIDDRYCHLEQVHGPVKTRLAAESHTAAINRIEAIVNLEHIDCDFRRVDGYLFMPPGQTTQLLEQELQACHRAGLVGVEMCPQSPLGQVNTGPALRFPMQGQFNPLRYYHGLLAAIELAGGRVFTDTHVVDVSGKGLGSVITRDGCVVTADTVVICTNSPVNDRVAIHTKQAAYRTYVIAAMVPKDSVPTALFWDMADPYHYVRTQSAKDHDVLIIGGEDHKTGQGASAMAWARLEEWGRRLFPMIQGIEARWSGQVMETMDGLGFIGRNPGDEPNVFIATGDSGMGMTHGTIAGMVLTDLILQRKNVWTDLYDPSRRPVSAAGEFIRENANVAAQYSQWVTAGQVTSPEQITPGEGAVMRLGLRKLAIFRDEAGRTHAFSAACRHLGCVLSWNACEKTWDCPCHGSRYDPYGRVLNGPGNENMTPVDFSHIPGAKDEAEVKGHGKKSA